MEIAIDFDGTCVTHEFPFVGQDIGAASILKELVLNGHKLVLFTMRSNTDRGNYLSDAIQWFRDNDIPLWGIQSNPNQGKWTTSPKAYAELYIDDAALGCPLIRDPNIANRPFVDWKKVKDLLTERGLFNIK